MIKDIVLSAAGGSSGPLVGTNWTYQGGLRTATANAYSPNDRCLIWNGSKFVGIGNAGKTVTSTDGINWTDGTSLAATSFGTASCYGIAWGNSKFVVVGGAARAATSPDGITWTYQGGLATAWGTTAGNTVCWSGSQFVAGGASGKIATSPDGITWTNRTGLSSTGFSTQAVNKIVWDSTRSQFVAIGGNKIATSTDGITWTYRGTSPGRYNLNDILVIGSDYVANAAYGALVKSTDGGVSFTLLDIGFPTDSFGSTVVSGAAYDGATLCILGNYDRVALTSNNGLTWSFNRGIETAAAGGYEAGVVGYGASKFVAVANGLTYTSTDGVTWSKNTQLGTTGYATYNSDKPPHWNGSRFLIGHSGYGQAGRTATSTDGITWTASTQLGTVFNTQSLINSIAWNGSIYCISGTDNASATSSDGLTWTNRTGFSTLWGASGGPFIAWGNSKFVAVNSSGRAATSTDGITWTNQTGLSSTGWGTTSPVGFIFDGTKFIASAADKIATSTDGITWTYLSAVGCKGQIIKCGSTFMSFDTYATGDSVSFSTDLSTWTASVGFRPYGSYMGLTYALSYNEGVLVAYSNQFQCAVGAYGGTYKLGNGLYSSAPWSYSAVRGAVYGANKLVVIGDGGHSATSIG